MNTHTPLTQVLPQARDFKRLLTMSNQYFHCHFVAPYPARTIYGKIRRFPERPPKQSVEGDKSSSSGGSIECAENKEVSL